MPKIVDVADQIYQEIGDPDDTSIASIAFWIRNNVGKLNSLIHTSYRVDPVTYEYSPAIDEEERAVLVSLYRVHYYGMKVRSNLGAAATAPVLEVTSDGATVRKVNMSTVAKDWMQLKRDEEKNVKDMVAAYNIDKAAPQQVSGDDNVSAYDVDFTSVDAFNRSAP